MRLRFHLCSTLPSSARVSRTQPDCSHHQPPLRSLREGGKIQTLLLTVQIASNKFYPVFTQRIKPIARSRSFIWPCCGGAEMPAGGGGGGGYQEARRAGPGGFVSPQPLENKPTNHHLTPIIAGSVSQCDRVAFQLTTVPSAFLELSLQPRFLLNNHRPQGNFLGTWPLYDIKTIFICNPWRAEDFKKPFSWLWFKCQITGY